MGPRSNAADLTSITPEESSRRLPGPKEYVIVAAVAVVLGAAALLRPDTLVWRNTAAVTVVVLVAVVVAMVIMATPRVLLLTVLPAAFFAIRLGDAGGSISIADVALLAASLVAIIALPQPGEHARVLVAILAVYAVLLAFAVVANPTSRAVVEWSHRLLLTGGGAIVGLALVAWGRSRRALQLFIATAAVWATGAVVLSLVSDLQPAWPPGTSKNLLGGLLAIAALVVVGGGSRLIPAQALRIAMILLLFVGLLATQSRGALIGLMAGTAYLIFRRALPNRSVALAGVMLVVVIAGIAAITVRSEAVSGGGEFSNISTRVEYQQLASGFWQEEPLLGQGLRYFLDPGVGFPRPPSSDPDGGSPHPHNVVLETLSESGVVGLVALAVLITATLALLGRVSNFYGLIAGAVLIAGLAHAMVDIYWLAGLLAVQWVIVGLAIGQADATTSASRQGLKPMGGMAKLQTGGRG